MKGILRAATASGFLLTFAALGLHAQARVVLGLGGGVVIPTKSGFNAVENPELSVKSVGFGGQFMFGILPSPDSKVSIRFDLAYDNVHYESVAGRTKDPKMSIRNFNADIVFHAGGQGNVRPYILAGPTVISWDYRPNDPSGTGKVKGSFGFNGGVGLNLGSPSKTLSFFIESRYIWTKSQAIAQGTTAGEEKGTGFIPIIVGIRIRPMEGQ
ncbi:MAG TPA: outer membrane beta-barrel protein [Gemmatimonadales bacterium]|nr:outer membrane beta-barrel protein [Gemmatimonadales bacterium]